MVSQNFINPELWIDIKTVRDLGLTETIKKVVIVVCAICLLVRLGDRRVRICFATVDNLVVSTLLETSYTDRIII